MLMMELGSILQRAVDQVPPEADEAALMQLGHLGGHGGKEEGDDEGGDRPPWRPRKRAKNQR